MTCDREAADLHGRKQTDLSIQLGRPRADSVAIPRFLFFFFFPARGCNRGRDTEVGLATSSCMHGRVRVFMKTHALKCVCKSVRVCVSEWTGSFSMFNDHGKLTCMQTSGWPSISILFLHPCVNVWRHAASPRVSVSAYHMPASPLYTSAGFKCFFSSAWWQRVCCGHILIQ